MAGLKMNVEFPTRLCEVKGELGYFHFWEQWSNVVDASLLLGGHPAGQIGQVYGIVEFKDGVRRVDPVSIKFCDEENADLCALVKHNEALRKGEVNVQPFIDGASSISPAMFSGVQALTDAILLLTKAELVQGIASWFTGGSSLSDFADELVPFGESMTEFSNAISGMDADLVSKAATAGKALAEMATTLPNSGGVVGFFAGENDMDKFGEQLVPFGKAMKD